MASNLKNDSNWRELYPFESHFLNLDSHRYHYLDQGNGQPLVMVHGNPTWSFYWRNLITAFQSSNRIIVPDHIGCGLSDKPQDYPYSLQQHINNLAKLIEHLDLQQITLLVHDWGGAIGLGAALKTPERFSRLVVFNTGAFPPPYVPWRILACRTPLLGTFAMRGLNLFAKAALSMATEKAERFTNQVCAGLLAPYGNWHDRVGIARFVQDIPLSKHHPTHAVLEEIENGLKRFNQIPIQLIWGAKDWCFRLECFERFATHWPQAEKHIFKDAGHYVIEDAHEQIIPLLAEFMNQSNT